MSVSFDIKSSTGDYRVEVERGAFKRLLAGFTSDVVIADEFFQPTFAEAGAKATFVEAVETNKSLEASPSLIQEIRRSGANRQSRLVAVGGGIVQDLSAFIASVYMRGLRWVYVPTTVLAMVDSCIGGKSSINVGPYKNLVGTFHPPEKVLIDPDVIATLPEDQRASGLIEAAKICFCRGEDAFREYLACSASIHTEGELLEKVISVSLLSKKWFIEIDEFDNKERLLLNFGHTFGHAMEGATHFAIPHGIAVGLGIQCALEFERLRGVDYGASARVALLETHLAEMIAQIPDLSSVLKKMKIDDVLERFESDKKHRADVYTLILVAAGGEVELRRVERSDAIRNDVRRAIERTIERYL